MNKLGGPGRTPWIFPQQPYVQKEKQPSVRPNKGKGAPNTARKRWKKAMMAVVAAGRFKREGRRRQSSVPMLEKKQRKININQ